MRRCVSRSVHLLQVAEQTLTGRDPLQRIRERFDRVLQEDLPALNGMLRERGLGPVITGPRAVSAR